MSPRFQAAVPSAPADRAARVLHALAVLVLLATVVGRAFLGEMPFRTSQLRALPAVQPGEEPPVLAADRTELARVVFSLMLLGAWVAFLVSAGLRGQLRLRLPLVGALVVVFAGLSLASALYAGDRRTALDAWLEQTALLAACYLGAQVFQDRRSFGLLVIVLAAAAFALTVKGLVQVLVEVPDRVADFDQNRLARLADMNIQPGSEQERLLEGRLKDPAPFGYLSLANPFASTLLVMTLAAGGLAADKFRRARAQRAQVRLARGEVHLPTVAAGLGALFLPAMGAVVLLARSLGASISFLAALAAAAGIYLWRDRLGRHRRKVLLGVGAAFVLGLAATIAHGLYHDRLPSKTMTFRWHYWTGAMRALAERPWLGVGPASFSTAYTLHRPIQGEETVKDPHNVIVHALVQHGIPGGTCYLAVLVLVLVGMARPVRAGEELTALPAVAGPPGVAVAAGVCVLAVPAVRLLFADTWSSGQLIQYDAIAPAVVLALGFLIALWAGGPLRQGPDTPATASRIALACGLAGFALHSMVETSPYMPASATTFWIAAGGALAVAGPGKVVDLTVLRWPLAGVLAGLTVALAAWLAPPVAARAEYAQRMLDAMVVRDSGAAGWAERAAHADPLDPLAAHDAARMHLSACPRGGPALPVCLEQARRWAREAVARDGSDFANHSMLADLSWYAVFPDCYVYWSLHARPEADKAFQPPGLPPLVLADQAALALRQGKPERAFSLLTQAAGLDGRSPCLWDRLAEAAWLAGQADAARTAWSKARALYAAGGKPAQEALDSLARAVALNGADLRLRLDYARRLAALGQNARCREQLHAAQTIHDSYYADSVSRFTPAELQTLKMVRELCSP